MEDEVLSYLKKPLIQLLESTMRLTTHSIIRCHMMFLDQLCRRKPFIVNNSYTGMGQP